MPYKDADVQRKAQARWAREHRTEARTRVKRRNAQIVIDAKNRPCMDCKREYHPHVMDFDHRDGEVKLGTLSRLANSGVSVARMHAEIAKCDVVCANCHRERTWLRLQSDPVLRRGLEDDPQLMLLLTTE